MLTDRGKKFFRDSSWSWLNPVNEYNDVNKYVVNMLTG
jgi:hypothetical protein